MPNCNSLTPEANFKGLFIGKSGSGKTVAECSFPRPIEVWDFDGRIRGILGAPWIDRANGLFYDSFPPKEVGMLQRLMTKVDMMQSEALGGRLAIKTLVLDSLTTQTFAMVCQALPLTHSTGTQQSGKKGRYLGPVPMVSPEDYGFEANTTYSLIASLRSIPGINLIVSAHIVERYGKPELKGEEQPYADSIIIGEKLSVRDKIGENIMAYFDHVFRFEKREEGSRLRHYVKFRSELARTAYADLPDGELDITGKNFYETMMSFIPKQSLTN